MTGGSWERCPRTVHWFDLAMTARCVLHGGHEGLHSDGVRWWDEYGLQRPTEITPPDVVRSSSQVSSGRPRSYACGICNGLGHNRVSCPQAAS